MQVEYKVSDKITLSDEADTQVEAFKILAAWEEIYGPRECGLCKSDVYYRVRKNKDEDEFPEVVCKNFNCKAVLALGQHKKGGGLYPHRKDKEGKWIPNNGFQKYVPKTGIDLGS